MTPSVIAGFVAATLAAGLAVGALLRGAKSLVSWTFALGMIVLAAEAVCGGLADFTAVPENIAHWQRGRLIALAFAPGAWLLFSLIYSRANSGSFLKQWRTLLAGMFVAPLALTLVFPDALVANVEPDPDAVIVVRLAWAGLVLNGIMVVNSILLLANLERTFLDSVGTMRWRLKYMVLGLGLLFGVRIYTGSQALLYRWTSPTLCAVDAVALAVACVLGLVSLFRAKLPEIEIYPSHAVLQGSMFALLAGIYLVVVGIFATVVKAVGGDAAFPIKAFLVLLALVGLGVLLLSDRMRQRVRLFVSRHFSRPLYDYRKVWSAFTERTTSLVDKTAFCRTVAKLISETFGCLSVTVWLVDEQGEQLTCATSTLLAEQSARALVDSDQDSAALLKAMRARPQPVDLDGEGEAWVADLKKWNPDFFAKGGNRVCVPLVSAGDVLGMIALADRVSGVRLTAVDLDLLKCIGDQVAASLRNIQLSDQILRAKEMAAFQTMSTFFVHDLKNMAYTLSLMLRNMSEHFGDPEFRDDALRSLSKSVTHLNDLIGRFSLLRQGLEIKRVEADLNDVVRAALKSVGDLPDVVVTPELAPLPAVLIDPAQVEKVVTNLVLNAKDAVGARGEIRVETGRRGGWTFLSVADNGCGMDREFIQGSLFKPFKTTKKNGMGIGMYHSKMIVEAHRGRLEVDSTTGKGSTFRVLFPTEIAQS